jgi:hypothetical protein
MVGGIRVARRIAVVAAGLAVWFVLTMAFGTIKAEAGVGELGPPPSEAEVKQTLTDLYNAGYPPDFTIDVQFDGPIIVGQPTVRPNPPPQPWCVRCGYPDQGSSQMYPVVAIVSVTTTQGLVSSALPPNSFVHTTNTSYNGTACPGETKAEYCPTYFFYRNEHGVWQAA